MKIEIIDRPGPSVPLDRGFFMHGMKIEPPEPKPELPEFGFSPRRDLRETFLANVRRDWERGALRSRARVAHPQVRLRIVGRPGPAMPARIRATTKAREHTGTADPIWDVAFALKFSEDPSDQQPIKEPEGTASPLKAFNDKVAELRWLTETQDRDLATTLDTFRANSIPVISLNYQPREDPEVRALRADRGEPWPAFIRLPDRVITDPVTGMTYTEPRYGDIKYIAAMERRIEWERWRSENGVRLKALFGRLRNGDLSIEALGKGHDADAKLAIQRRLKAAWLANHDRLPTPHEVEQIRKEAEGKRLLDAMSAEEREAWERRHVDDPEDTAPGRDAFHADPDPRPTRDQYPFGDHRHCDLPDDPGIPALHRGCTDDGWDLYNADLAVWQKAAEERGDIGYAGPNGLLGIEAKDKASNPFFRPEEDDTQRGEWAPPIQRWKRA